MSATPQPPRPPVAPVPPRTGSHILLIVLMFLALIVVVAVSTVWVGLRYLSHGIHVTTDSGPNGKREVSVQTPVGTFQAGSRADVDSIGLPVYPGSNRVNDNGSVSLNMSFLDDKKVQVMVAKFETPDGTDKVREYYKSRLENQVTKEKDQDSDGNITFEIKRNDVDQVVVLKPHGTGTTIVLVRTGAGGGASVN
jgi:hypothetical protein